MICFDFAYNTQGRIGTITDQRQISNYNYDSTGQYLLSIEDTNSKTSLSYDNSYDPTILNH
ncbi:MAG TPA: hypothetical protein V6C71_26470 [Coleofasciculaceae cyanobacterium]|jgi:YD repeat-containing protein